MIIDLLNEYWKEIATALFVAWAIWISKSIHTNIVDSKIRNVKIQNVQDKLNELVEFTNTKSAKIESCLEQNIAETKVIEKKMLEYKKQYLEFVSSKEAEISKLKKENKKLKSSSKK